MIPLRLHRALPVAVAALAAVLCTSCSESNGTVKGTITVNGKPLPSGLITFNSEVGNKDAYSANIQDGLYETGPIPTGPCKITVIHSAVPKPGEEGGNDLVRGRPRGKGANVMEVPAKYGRTDSSGLAFTVKSGANTYDQDLK